jgi:hypothetical protein
MVLTPTLIRVARHFRNRAFYIICLLFLVAASPMKAGVALRLFYNNIPGDPVANLTNHTNFPDRPNSAEPLTQVLERLNSISDNYGTWTRGYLEAPQTGSYIFWVASDNDSELWLGTNYTSGGLRKIAEVSGGAVSARSFMTRPAQQSKPIALVQGERYYFELLFKEGTGADHFSVAWQLPDGKKEEPIPSIRLMPFPVDTAYLPVEKAPEILTEYWGKPVDTLQNASAVEGSPITFAVTVDATQPVTFQWFRNHEPIRGANLSTYTITNVQLQNDVDLYSVTVSNRLGEASAEAVLSVFPDKPAALGAFNLSDESSIAVVFSRPIDPATATNLGNYILNEGKVRSATITPASDTVLLQTSPLAEGKDCALVINNVKDRVQNVIAPSSTVAIEQGLRYWYKFDDASETREAHDSSGHDYAAHLNGNPVFDPAGKFGGCLNFDGEDDSAELPAGASDFASGFTIALWARPTAIRRWGRFIDFGNGSAVDNILLTRENTFNTLQFEIYTDHASSTKVIARDAIELNKWQHFAASVDRSGKVSIYKNGVSVAEGLGPPVKSVLRTNNFVGRSNWKQDILYAGQMDDLRVYDRPLAASEIRVLARRESNHPLVNINATTPIAVEKGGRPAVFTVSRDSGLGPDLLVKYAMSGTASNGVDYKPLSGVVTIPAGKATATVSVVPINDGIAEEPVEKVVLALQEDAAYTRGLSDSAEASILDYDETPPVAIAATADTAIDIWFSENVDPRGAGEAGNYKLSDASITITNATVSGRRVSLAFSGSLADAETTVAISKVPDLSGNKIAPQILRIEHLLTPSNVVAVAYHSPDQRASCFSLVTDSIVDNINDTGGFDTFNIKGTQFAGLLYAEEQKFSAIKVDLGFQFPDGGDWASPPKVFILKKKMDPGSTRPETDPDNWRELPEIMVSDGRFHPELEENPSPNTPIFFYLGDFPEAERTGFGWAVGAAPGNGAQGFVSVSELRAYGSSH